MTSLLESEQKAMYQDLETFLKENIKGFIKLMSQHGNTAIIQVYEDGLYKVKALRVGKK